MKMIFIFILFLMVFVACTKKDDSDEIFKKAEGFLKLNMYKESLELYIELKSRNYKTDLIEERIKYVSTKIAEERLKSETKAIIQYQKPVESQKKITNTASTSEFKVSRCDNSYNERIDNVKNEMKPYQDELNDIEKKLSKISSEYKVVNKDGVYSIAVPSDTPPEKQKEIAEGPAREFGTLNARKNEILQKINKFNEDIERIIEESRKAGQPSDCIRR